MSRSWDCGKSIVLSFAYKDLDIDKCIQGLVDFRKEFIGKIWLEIFILPDFNDGINELTELKKAILKIKPDLVQLNTLDRPGTGSNLKSATRKDLQKIVDFWNLDNIGIIASSTERKHILSYRNDVEAVILETISRRPCTLDVLDTEEKIEAVEQERGVFYQIKEK